MSSIYYVDGNSPLPEQLIDVFETLEKQSKVQSKLVKQLLIHNIDTSITKPLSQAPRRLPFVTEQEAEKELQEILENDILET